MEVFSTAISSGVNISKVPGCHLSQQMSSQWGSQKLLQGLVSYEITTYLSVSNLFLIQWIMAILSKGCKPDKLEPNNSQILALQIFEGFVTILLNVNLSLNQTLRTYLLFRQTWMTQVILAISLWGVIFLRYEKILLLYAWSCSLCERTISRKIFGFLLMLSIGFTSLIVLLPFPLLITFFADLHDFWFYFI